jgi:hypothetical protein
MCQFVSLFVFGLVFDFFVFDFCVFSLSLILLVFPTHSQIRDPHDGSSESEEHRVQVAEGLAVGYRQTRLAGAAAGNTIRALGEGAVGE